MIVEEAICTQLENDSAVVALAGTRVYQLRLPQNPTYPAVRVQMIGVLDFYHLRGGDLAERSRVQVDAFAGEASGTDPYTQVINLGEAIHAALNGQRFVVADSPVTLQVTGIMRIGRLPLYESEELRIVRMMQDYIVWTRRIL